MGVLGGNRHEIAVLFQVREIRPGGMYYQDVAHLKGGVTYAERTQADGTRAPVYGE